MVHTFHGLVWHGIKVHQYNAMQKGQKVKIINKLSKLVNNYSNYEAVFFFIYRSIYLILKTIHLKREGKQNISIGSCCTDLHLVLQPVTLKKLLNQCFLLFLSTVIGDWLTWVVSYDAQQHTEGVAVSILKYEYVFFCKNHQHIILHFLSNNGDR